MSSLLHPFRSGIVRPLAGCVLVATLGLSVHGQTLPSRNPYGGKQSAAAPAAEVPTSSEFELTGVMKLGPNTHVCITTLADKKSYWIKVGQRVNGIQVLNHNAQTDTVTIRQGGRDIPLGLKQATFDPAALASVQAATVSTAPLPSAGVALNVALTEEEKAAEARMLVSDLLEIGMEQRKAYAEKQAEERAAKLEEAKQKARAEANRR